MNRLQHARPNRPGYTLIELLVAMFVIGVLVSLLMPAVQQARSAARRTQCLNNLRNVNLAMLQVTESTGRFPACGNFAREFGSQHSWVVDVLPWLEQGTIAQKWDKDRTINDPVNAPLTRLHIPILTCPDDISVTGEGDLSYVVNGGIGFTTYLRGMHDCPVDPTWTPMDFNGNGITCLPPGQKDGSPGDKLLFLRTGLFFNETWKWNVTRRHHRPSTVLDGLTNTITLTENVRTGYDPSQSKPLYSWASPNPVLTSFYIGNPCTGGDCSPGNVDYRRANAGQFAINSGLTSPEGESPVPNSFHTGGVNMAFGDGRVQFVSQHIDGLVYACLVSPQGMHLEGTPLAQPPVTDGSY